jgi:hypothetical protein
MHTQLVLAALCGNALAITLTAFSETINPTCARDNCLQAVIASGAAPSPSSAAADCSSFFLKTVTPATVYVWHLGEQGQWNLTDFLVEQALLPP